MVYSETLERFVLLGGTVSHAFTGQRGYDVQTFDPTLFEKPASSSSSYWENQLPAAGLEWGKQTGIVNAPGFKSPYFSMQDKEGVTRPSPRHMVLHYQYALAPWDNSIYALSSGHLLRYNLKTRVWTELTPGVSPAPAARSYKLSLNWGALCADPVNRELVLFGGCGVATESGDQGHGFIRPKKMHGVSYNSMYNHLQELWPLWCSTRPRSRFFFSEAINSTLC